MNKVTERDYILPIKGMSIGKHFFDFAIDNSFFENYPQKDILGADIKISLIFEKGSNIIEIKGLMEGSVTTQCDRCLEEMTTVVDRDLMLLVKFSDEVSEETDDIMVLSTTESELDLRQFFYDYIALSLPLQRVHKSGECDPEMIEKLNKYSGKISESKESVSPFEKLKDLIN